MVQEGETLSSTGMHTYCGGKDLNQLKAARWWVGLRELEK